MDHHRPGQKHLCAATSPHFHTWYAAVVIIPPCPLCVTASPHTTGERIIGVTDPEDDTLVIWGIIREGEAPKQLVAGGEFFTLKRVERVAKVGDVLGIPLVPGGDE